MFIRYNQLSKYFEYDASGGLGVGPWIKLEIDASQIIGIIPAGQLPGNIAYLDRAQTFTQYQVISSPTIAELSLIESSANLLLRLINYQSRFQVYYNPVGQLFGVDLVGNIAVRNDIYEKGRGLPLGHWGTWTPGWASNIAPLPTNGVLSGKYTLIGKTCHFNIRLSFNGSTTFGAPGNVWVFLLPFTAAGSINEVIGSAFLYRAGVIYKTGISMLYDGNYVMLLSDDVNANVGSNVPFVWSVNDQLIFNGTYQMA